MYIIVTIIKWLGPDSCEEPYLGSIPGTILVRHPSIIRSSSGGLLHCLGGLVLYDLSSSHLEELCWTVKLVDKDSLVGSLDLLRTAQESTLLFSVHFSLSPHYNNLIRDIQELTALAIIFSLRCDLVSVTIPVLLGDLQDFT